MKVNQQMIDLGTVGLEKERKFNYLITNDSDKEVKVTKLTVGCNSCTKAMLNMPLLSPGQSAPIEVIFTPNSTGVNIKSVNIDYEQGGVHMPVYTLKFKAMVTASGS